jgi:fermentation-respiration switch protein FrsA (DUF1100 family)
MSELHAEDLIFYPEKELLGKPGDLGLEFEDVTFRMADALNLHGWYVPGSRSETILWCHGNAGNISDRLDQIKLFHDRVGVNIFIFDYRGYGRSQGRPTEDGTYRDAHGALDYLRSRPDVEEDKIVVFGQSLGGAIAVDLACRNRLLGLILEATFTSLPDIFEMSPKNFHIKYDSYSKIKRVRVPLLMLHGDRDDVVPFESGYTLYKAANEPKKFCAIAGAMHSDNYIVGGDGYFAAVEEFITGLSDK